METYVRKHDSRPRFELVEYDDVIGVADYREDGDRLIFHHTEIPRQLRGQGKGDRLVRGALDVVRSEGKKVVPRCWFVAEFFDHHPEYRDLRAS